MKRKWWTLDCRSAYYLDVFIYFFLFLLLTRDLKHVWNAWEHISSFLFAANRACSILTHFFCTNMRTLPATGWNERKIFEFSLPASTLMKICSPAKSSQFRITFKSSFWSSGSFYFNPLERSSQKHCQGSDLSLI